MHRVPVQYLKERDLYMMFVCYRAFQCGNTQLGYLGTSETVHCMACCAASCTLRIKAPSRRKLHHGKWTLKSSRSTVRLCGKARYWQWAWQNSTCFWVRTWLNHSIENTVMGRGAKLCPLKVRVRRVSLSAQGCWITRESQVRSFLRKR